MRGTVTRGKAFAVVCLALIGVILGAGAATAELLVLPDGWGSDEVFVQLVTPDSPGDQTQDTGAPWMFGANPLDGAPLYQWWYGCSPTAGGMMIGWWDTVGGRNNLYSGDASVWTGDLNSGTKRMVASQEHRNAGIALGYSQYGSYLNHDPNSIADFMKTDNSGTAGNNIASGLVAYANWDDPTTPLNEAYQATGSSNAVPWQSGSFGWNAYKAEIDAGRPMLLDLVTYYGTSWLGHTVFAYGYMQVDGYNWFAVRDTWSLTGNSGNGDAAYWYDGSQYVDNRLINGVEWWPFLPYTGASYSGVYDWRVVQGDYFNVSHQPEPATVACLVLGLLGMIAIRRRKLRVS